MRVDELQYCGGSIGQKISLNGFGRSGIEIREPKSSVSDLFRIYREFPISLHNFDDDFSRPSP